MMDWPHTAHRFCYASLESVNDENGRDGITFVLANYDGIQQGAKPIYGRVTCRQVHLFDYQTCHQRNLDGDEVFPIFLPDVYCRELLGAEIPRAFSQAGYRFGSIPDSDRYFQVFMGEGGASIIVLCGELEVEPFVYR